MYTVIVAILLSQSAIGMFCLISVLAYWLIKNPKFLRTHFIYLIPIFACLMFVVFKYGLLTKAWDRVLTVREAGTTTGTVRLLRGFIVFSKLPTLYKIIGIGAGNYFAFIMAYKELKNNKK